MVCLTVSTVSFLYECIWTNGYKVGFVSLFHSFYWSCWFRKHQYSTVLADFDLIDFIISLDLLVSLISLIFFDLVSVVGLVVLLFLLILVIRFGLVCHVGLLCLVGLIWSSLSSSFSSLVGLVCLFHSLGFVILASLA